MEILLGIGLLVFLYKVVGAKTFSRIKVPSFNPFHRKSSSHKQVNNKALSTWIRRAFILLGIIILLNSLNFIIQLLTYGLDYLI